MVNCFPWPGRHQHLSASIIDAWINRCNRFYVRPTYSVGVEWSCQDDLHIVCDKLKKANGILGLFWGPNEKIGATNADPNWDAASNDEEWASQLATFRQIIDSYGVQIAAGSVDVECYTWERYTPISGAKLTKSRWNTARKNRLQVLKNQFATAFGVIPSMYGAMRAIPQVRSSDLGISGWGVSPNIDGTWELGMYDANWWHVSTINGAAHAMTMRSAGKTRKIVPYHWLGIRRDRQLMKDMAVSGSFAADHVECARLYRNTEASIDHLWTYTSVSDEMLAEANITRADHEAHLELDLDGLYHGLYKPITQPFVAEPVTN